MSTKNTEEHTEEELNQQEEINSQGEESTETVENEGVEADPMVELQQELGEWKNKYLRLHAEFDNFRKRTIKERSDLIKNAGSDVIAHILPVVDDFDRAVAANEDNADIDAVKEGFVLIQHKLLGLLEQRGLKPMDAKGKDFDTDHHEAITQFPGDEAMKNKVVDVVEKGYFLNESVLRFAKVVVGS